MTDPGRTAPTPAPGPPDQPRLVVDVTVSDVAVSDVTVSVVAVSDVTVSDVTPPHGAFRPGVERVELGGSKRRLVEHLKRRDSATAPELAAAFGLTDTALRQHLETLEAMGFVERIVMRGGGRGRPPQHWRLTTSASVLFPDGHGDLTVELIESVRDALGDDGLARVVQARAERQVRAYARVVAEGDAGCETARDTACDSARGSAHGAVHDTLLRRVRSLAAVRSDEGYLAEAVVDGDDVLLVEHHCPIGGAARACSGICDAELIVFRGVLGDDVQVERESHALAGDRCCTYRISPSITARVAASR